MRKLIQGVKSFQDRVFPEERELFSKLANAQNPETMMVACADSRVVPKLITQAKPGEIFIQRNVGNIVPPYRANSSEGASVELAVVKLKVRDIIVCGHSDCGAMNLLFNDELLEKLPACKNWLTAAAATRRIVEENFPELEGPAKVEKAVEVNVLVQLDNLRTHPVVAAARAKGAIRLHGWIYRIDTGEVTAYDHQEGVFKPLGDSRALEEII